MLIYNIVFYVLLWPSIHYQVTISIVKRLVFSLHMPSLIICLLFFLPVVSTYSLICFGSFQNNSMQHQNILFIGNKELRYAFYVRNISISKEKNEAYTLTLS